MSNLIAILMRETEMLHLHKVFLDRLDLRYTFPRIH